MVIKGRVQMSKQWESPALLLWESSVFAEVAHPTWTEHIQPGDSALAMLPQKASEEERFLTSLSKGGKVWCRLTVKEGRPVVPAAADAVLFPTTALLAWANGELSSSL